MIFNQLEFKENYLIANQFNNYFVDSIKSIRNPIEHVQHVNRTDMINTKFMFRAINIIEHNISIIIIYYIFIYYNRYSYFFFLNAFKKPVNIFPNFSFLFESTILPVNKSLNDPWLH